MTQIQEDALISRFHELFEYRDGALIRKMTVSHNAKIGAVVGVPNGSGYLLVMVDKKLFRVHRIIFAMFHSFLPKCIDHIDGDKSNNRIENLREATVSNNMWNRLARKDSGSGIKNIKNIRRGKKRWLVELRANGVRTTKCFATLDDAEAFARSFRKEKHGVFANHG